ncbi:MAG: SMI1/KNR4 family protein, partial [Planctomycetaceae bacterium]|nr:SMI1/KNR4 family protein [Planctomycetaceae bacterium]
MLTLEEIHGFAAEIGGRLAKEYVEFLLTQNGGRADLWFCLAWKDEIETVDIFRPLLPTFDRGIRRGLKDLRELGMDGFLPIASSLSGLEVCISCRENIGAIFITEYVYKIVFRGDRVPAAVTMAPLAPSFTDFLKMLVEIPDPYCRIQELGKKGTPANLDQYLAEG